MMSLVTKFFCVCLGLGVLSTARMIPDEGPEDLEILEEEYFKIQPRIFEDKILEALNNFKELLQNGDPANAVKPLDPFFLDCHHFDFILEDTELAGLLRDVTFTNFSRFEVTKVEFKLLPLHFKLDILVKQLQIDGKYRMAGKLFGELVVNGTGRFISETENLTLSLYVRPTKVNSNLQIKDIIFEFTTLSEQLNYTDEFVSDEFRTLDENLVLYVLSQVQEKYVPPLVNMVKVVLNHFLLGYTFQEVMDVILEFLNKNNRRQ